MCPVIQWCLPGDLLPDTQPNLLPQKIEIGTCRLDLRICFTLCSATAIPW